MEPSRLRDAAQCDAAEPEMTAHQRQCQYPPKLLDGGYDTEWLLAELRRSYPEWCEKWNAAELEHFTDDDHRQWRKHLPIRMRI